MVDPILLVTALMFLIGGGVTVMVGRRAKELGIPGWLGKAIMVTGALVFLAGLIGVFVTLFLLSGFSIWS